LGRDSTASMTETIDSLDNGDDETGSTSKQPTGTCWPGNTCDHHLHVFDVDVFGKDQLQACYQALATNQVEQKCCRELSLCSATNTLELLVLKLGMQCSHARWRTAVFNSQTEGGVSWL